MLPREAEWFNDGRCGAQDRQPDTVGRMDHVPERETEQPGHALHDLLGGDKRIAAVQGVSPVSRA